MFGPLFFLWVHNKRSEVEYEVEQHNHNVWPTIKGYDVKILAANGPKDVLEDPESEGIIVMEFPSSQAARAW